MSLLGLIIVLAVCGVALYLLNTFVPMDPKFKRAINVIVGLVLFVFLIYWLFGFLGWAGGPIGGPGPGYRGGCGYVR